MDTLEAIFNRRSIRQYTSAKVAGEQLTILLKSAMYAPSAVNKQPWHFIVFENKETIQKIIDIHPNASMLKNTARAILVCWNEHLKHDTGYGPVDCANATQNILLAAHSKIASLGYIAEKKAFPDRFNANRIHKEKW